MCSRSRVGAFSVFSVAVLSDWQMLYSSRLKSFFPHHTLFVHYNTGFMYCIVLSVWQVYFKFCMNVSTYTWIQGNKRPLWTNKRNLLSFRQKLWLRSWRFSWMFFSILTKKMALYFPLHLTQVVALTMILKITQMRCERVLSKLRPFWTWTKTTVWYKAAKDTGKNVLKQSSWITQLPIEPFTPKTVQPCDALNHLFMRWHPTHTHTHRHSIQQCWYSCSHFSWQSFLHTHCFTCPPSPPHRSDWLQFPLLQKCHTGSIWRPAESSKEP